MRLLVALFISHILVAASGCAPLSPNQDAVRPSARVEEAASPAKPERLDADTPKSTVAGNAFVAPAGWTVTVRGSSTVLEVPEGGSYIVIIDVTATDANAAVASAWESYKPDARWPLKAVTPIADRDGWTDRKGYSYQTSPNERRDVDVDVRRANDVWTVTILTWRRTSARNAALRLR
jgi:hypothetical protein